MLARLQREEEADLKAKRGSLKHPLEPAFYNPKLSFTAPSNRAALRFARNLFLRDYTFEQIFLRTGIPIPVYRKCRHRWRQLKERVDEGLIAEIRRTAVESKIDEFVQRGLKIGLRFLDRLEKDKQDLSVKDFKLVTDAIMAIHRVGQLEKGEPTDIVERNYNSMSQEEMRIYLYTMHKEINGKFGDVIPLPELSENETLQIETSRGRQEIINEIANESRRRSENEIPVAVDEQEVDNGEGEESLPIPEEAGGVLRELS